MQTTIIVSAFPLTFVLIATSFAILKDFNAEMKNRKKLNPKTK